MTPLSKQPKPSPAIDKPVRTKPLIKVDGTHVTTCADKTGWVFGSTDENFIDGLVGQLVNIGSPGKVPDQKGTAFVASIVQGINPRDQIEAMLASQMAAVHLSTMTFARRLAHVDTIPQQDSAERAFNKLARTFAAQVEALKRYRTGGEQKMTVEHVHVHPGGQAIVGDVHTGGTR
ncbi:hypothetical protein [Mesorhizobium sp. KR9-304]|uniref:hypothetical protein n=1 Tax=Mesorhizobium sp. KR9-304 TaxID=3156614 RepID=UPI0032B510AE